MQHNQKHFDKYNASPTKWSISSFGLLPPPHPPVSSVESVNLCFPLPSANFRHLAPASSFAVVLLLVSKQSTDLIKGFVIYHYHHPYLRFHHIFTSTMYPVISVPPSSSGGCQLTTQLSWKTFVTVQFFGCNDANHYVFSCTLLFW